MLSLFQKCFTTIVKVLLALAIQNIKVEILSVAVNVAITHSCTYTTKPYMNSQA